jgi:hypothetical protein
MYADYSTSVALLELSKRSNTHWGYIVLNRLHIDHVNEKRCGQGMLIFIKHVILLRYKTKETGDEYWHPKCISYS